MTATAPTPQGRTLDDAELSLIDAYWRAANYLSVGQIYLLDNPLLRRPLQAVGHQAAAARPLGHDARPELHLGPRRPRDQAARPRRDHDRRPRPWRPRGGRQRVSRGHLVGALLGGRPRRGGHPRTSSASSRSRAASAATCTPEVPGSINEGGELGYSLAHAYGAAFDNPGLTVFCVVGDGEAETGAAGHQLAREQVPQPGARRRRAADPAPQRLQDRQSDGPGAHPGKGVGRAVRGLRLRAVHRRRRTTRRRCIAGSPRCSTRSSTRSPRSSAGRARRGDATRPTWPMIVLRSPEGLDRPQGGRRQADRGHVAGAPGPARRCARRSGAPGAARRLDAQLPAATSCSTEDGRLVPELADFPPRGDRRMSANPHANGGELLRDLDAARLSRLRRRGAAPGADLRRGDARAGPLPARRHQGQSRPISACSGRTRPTQTACRRSSRSPSRQFRASCCQPTNTRRPRAG